LLPLDGAKHRGIEWRRAPLSPKMPAARATRPGGEPVNE